MPLASCAVNGTGTAKCYDPSLVSGFELVPEVMQILESCGPHAHMAVNYIKYAKALVAADDTLDAIVAPDVRLHDLEPAGFTGLSGLKEFRRQRAGSLGYERAVIQTMRFPAADVTEVELCTERSNVATGARLSVVIHARDRWVDDKVVERWHRIEQLPTGSCGPAW